LLYIIRQNMNAQNASAIGFWAPVNIIPIESYEAANKLIDGLINFVRGREATARPE